MNKKLIAILTSLSISPVLLLSDGGECVANSESMPKKGAFAPKRAHQAEKVSCGLSPPSQRVEVKHIEGKGVGYKTGYSSLEGFFTIPYLLEGSWFPFLDLRGHIFDDGKPAATGGLGVRYLGNTRVWGANVYYDYRETHHRHFNQVGAGLESLGKIWDFRLNAYIPVGKKDSHLFHTHFHEFKHNSIILKSRKEIAMKGANAEVGAHALRRENYQLYAATGPYYFEREAKVAWGGEARVAFTTMDYLRLQLSASYDSIFKGIVQGEVAFTFSFGGKRAIKSRSCNDCGDRKMIARRALQRVDRNEIIVVDRKHQKTKAINPATGDPYKVWFVDNTSHSQGTFESPFNTLADAQNSAKPYDIIYVYVGDGTDNGMNAGITLQKGQQLLGAGMGQQVQTTKGLIHIRAHDKGLPKISNTFAVSTNPLILGPAAVGLSEGNNVVAGFYLVDNFGGGSGSDVSGALLIEDGLNYLIQNNILTTNSTNGGGNGLNIFGGGNITVANNTFIGLDKGDTFGVDFENFSNLTAPIQGYYLFKNNLFTGANANSGFAIGWFSEIRANANVRGNINITVIGNTSNSQSNTTGSPAGIQILSNVNPTQAVTVNILDNNVVMPAGITGASPGGIRVASFGPGPTFAHIHGNVSLTNVSATPTVPGYIFNDEGDPPALHLDVGPDNFGTVKLVL